MNAYLQEIDKIDDALLIQIVEISSIYTTRSRLKQRFKLEEDEDLDSYFKQIL